MISQFFKTKSIFIVLVLLALLPIWEVLISSNLVLGGRDLSFLVLPAKQFWLESVQADWSIPRWNHLMLGGVPFYADSTNYPLHPFNFIFLFFNNAVDGLELFIALHFIFLAFGAFLLFRQFRLTKIQSLIFCLPLLWGGVAQGTIITPNHLACYACFPWLLYFLNAFIGRPCVLRIFPISLMIAMPIYVGDPQFSLLFGIFSVLFLCMNCIRIYQIAYMILLSLLCAAPQALPTLEMAMDSQRGLGDLSYEKSIRASYNPIRMLEWFFPKLFGQLEQAESMRWQEYLNAKEPFLFYFYIGASLFSLWLLSAMSWTKRIFTRELIFYYASFVVFLWLGFGSWVFPSLYKVFYQLIPTWDYFRYPERIIVLAHALFIFICAKQWSAVQENLSVKKLAIPMMVLFLLIALACGVMGISVLDYTIIHFLVFSVLILMTVFLRHKHKSSLVLLVVAADLIFAMSGISWTHPRWIFEKEQMIQTAELNQHSRLAYLNFNMNRSLEGLDTISKSTAAGIFNASPNIVSYWGIAQSNGHVNFSPKGKNQFLNLPAFTSVHTQKLSRTGSTIKLKWSAKESVNQIRIAERFNRNWIVASDSEGTKIEAAEDGGMRIIFDSPRQTGLISLEFKSRAIFYGNLLFLVWLIALAFHGRFLIPKLYKSKNCALQ